MSDNENINDEMDDNENEDGRPARRSGGDGRSGGGRRSGGFRGGGGGGRRFRRARICTFCVERVDKIDYKDVALLQRYVTDRGKIFARRQSGNCAKHQRAVARAIKRARHVALLPYTSEHTLD